MEENEWDRGGSEEEDQDIPLEEAERNELVPFDNKEIAAAVTLAGIVYISVPEICRAIGINAQPQTLRMRRTKVLRKGLRRIPLATTGGVKPAYCLRVDLVALWLGGIEFSRARQGTEQQRALREKIEYYQEELAPAATQVFMRVLGLSNTQMVPTQDPQVLAVAEELDMSLGITTLMREHQEDLLRALGYNSMQIDKAVLLLESLVQRQGQIDQLESRLAVVDDRTKYLTPEHARAVRSLVDRIAATLVQRTPGATSKLAHIEVYSRLKARFRYIGSYKEIDDARFEEIMQFLKDELIRAIRGDGPEQGSLFS